MVGAGSAFMTWNLVKVANLNPGVRCLYASCRSPSRNKPSISGNARFAIKSRMNGIGIRMSGLVCNKLRCCSGIGDSHTPPLMHSSICSCSIESRPTLLKAFDLIPVGDSFLCSCNHKLGHDRSSVTSPPGGDMAISSPAWGRPDQIVSSIWYKQNVTIIITASEEILRQHLFKPIDFLFEKMS
jgi:hypothetical protein